MAPGGTRADDHNLLPKPRRRGPADEANLKAYPLA